MGEKYKNIDKSVEKIYKPWYNNHAKANIINFLRCL